MIAMTIINAVFVVLMFIIAFTTYTMITSFGELIVRFIEQNQEYYKNQKHLLMKSSEIGSDIKKMSNSIATLKKVSTKLDRQSSREK